MIKHKKFIEDILMEIFFEDWMDEDDFQEMLSMMYDEGGVDLDNMSKEIELEVKRGNSLEKQKVLILEMFKRIKDGII